MRIKQTALPILLVMLVEPAWGREQRPDFELISYHLPKANISAKVSLTLERCTATDLVASGELAIAAEAGAAPAVFTLTSRQLESARVKRSLDIALHDTGTVSTVGISAEDRTGAIFGNVLRFVASVAGAVFGMNTAGVAAAPDPKIKLRCSDGIVGALNRVREIDAVLAKWRKGSVPSSPKDASDQSQAIDRLVAERAALRVGVLHVDLEAPLAMGDLHSGDGGGKPWSLTATVDAGPLAAAWLPPKAVAPTVTVAWTVALPTGASVPVPERRPDEVCREQLAAAAGQAVCLVTPVTANVTAQITGTGIDFAADGLSAQGAFPMPQWGRVRTLPLSAAFGSNREVSLTLDKFGRVSAAKWTSQARAENATTALAGLAEQGATIAAANSRTAREKSEIDALQTQQTLNRLRACREILDAGGSACPAEAPAAQ